MRQQRTTLVRRIRSRLSGRLDGARQRRTSQTCRDEVRARDVAAARDQAGRVGRSHGLHERAWRSGC